MYKCININFIDDKSFKVFYISNEDYKDEEDYKEVFKEINNILIIKYDMEFIGLYDVYIYKYNGIYILEFIYIDDYGSRDFNVTIYLNSKVLYEFYDSDLFKVDIYYDNKYYTYIDNVVDDIRLFEYGNIVYGKNADRVIKKGIKINN